MLKTLSEQNFENAIVADLVTLNGFHVAGPTDYDRELCLIPHALVRFLQVTQPQAWKELRTELGDEAESRIVKRVRNVIEKKGTLHVLRKGVTDQRSRTRQALRHPDGVGTIRHLHTGGHRRVLRGLLSQGQQGNRNQQPHRRQGFVRQFNSYNVHPCRYSRRRNWFAISRFVILRFAGSHCN